LSGAVDTGLTAETPEGVAIPIRCAGFPVRCIAFAIDAGIRIAVFLSLAALVGRAGQLGAGLMLILLFLVNWLYSVAFELLPAAATPGKRIMGLQVVMANGLPVTPAGSLIRNLMRAIDLLPAFYGFGVIVMLLRTDGRRLGDLAGGTVVVYAGELPPRGFFGDAPPLAPPMPLTARQRAAITAFAWRARRLTPERAAEIADLAVGVLPGEEPVRRLIGIAAWMNGQGQGVDAARVDS
jgi:uncharacterized RDD family membrane protein YckC